MTGEIKRLVKGSGEVCSSGQGSGQTLLWVKVDRRSTSASPKKTTAVYHPAGWRGRADLCVRGGFAHKNDVHLLNELFSSFSGVYLLQRLWTLFPSYIIFFLVALLCKCSINAKIPTLDYLLELCQEMNTNSCLSIKHLPNTSYVPASVLSVFYTH